MKNYTLKEYADLLSSVDMLAEAEMMGRDETVITYLTYDSRAVTPGTLFICKGAAFKEQYLENAIRAGAVAYVSEVQYETETKVPCLIVKDIFQQSMAGIDGHRFWRYKGKIHICLLYESHCG